MQLAHLPRLAIPLLAMTLGAGIGPAAAQSYPSDTIRIVLGGGAGTPPDIITRIVANELGQSEGWRIVVENKPGAIGTIAAGEVLKQPADGYSILAFVAPRRHRHLLPNIGFRHDSDFAPVIKVMSAHHVLVANPVVPAKSMAELVDLAGSQPDKLTFSSGGFGTPAHLAGEQFSFRRACASPTSPTGRCRRRLATSSTAPTTTSSLRHCRCLTSLPPASCARSR